MNKLMCHVVAGYPDADACLGLMKGMQKAGAAAIEVQIPFSDPIADGETIMRANDVALEGGMTTAKSFELIKQAGLGCDVYVMSYIQKVLHCGFEAFCEAVAKAGAKGLIIPDLPHESPEHKELLRLCRNYKLELVPVFSPGMPRERLKAALEDDPKCVYVTSRKGITGSEYAGGGELKRFVDDIRNQSDAEVMIGFGISTPQDVKDALELGDVAVVGSAFIKELQKSGDSLSLVKELIGARQ
ncbi:MAG TPA: tryptophan synthase subunit alpha [Candidatus Saccharimonadales bacterium]|nr:tryptophan synthase subunit alpha [Candidatus Saccharimonadales bacterium]